MSIALQKALYGASVVVAGTMLVTPQGVTDSYAQSLMMRQLFRTPTGVHKELAAEGIIQREEVKQIPPPLRKYYQRRTCSYN